jgi:hypothetical protein
VIVHEYAKTASHLEVQLWHQSEEDTPPMIKDCHKLQHKACNNTINCRCQGMWPSFSEWQITWKNNIYAKQGSTSYAVASLTIAKLWVSREMI